MKKILFGLLGVLFSISANAACNLYTTTNSSAGYIDANGVVHDTGGYLATDYISITPSTEYTVYARMTSSISGHGIRIAFYDTNKQFIAPRESGEAGSSGQYIYNLTSPANAKYIRMSTSESSSVVVDRTIVQGRYSLSTIPTNMSACANALDPCRNLFDKDTADANRIYGFFQQTGTAWHWADAGFSVRIPCKPNTTYTARYNGNDTQAVLGFGSTSNDNIPPSGSSVSVTQGIRQNNPTINTPITLTTGPNDKWLIVAYNVAEPQHSDMANNLQIEESDTATAYIPYCKKIKIATTKYNETKFSPLNTALANAISVVDSVVSNTITQAGRIATLQAQKQTRPNDIADDNEKCPAGKKCLLVEDASGIPHWYEIVENAWDLPDGYTELQYIESTGTQYIDTGIKSASTIKAEFVVDRPISPASGSVWVPMGTTLDNNGQFSIFESTNGSGDKYVALTYGVVNGSTVDASAGATAFAQSKFVLDGGVLTIDNGVKTITPPQAGTTFSTQNDIWLFLRPNTNVGVGVKMYYCKLWDNGTLVRDFVPAKDASGVVGMFDTVSGTFFTNAGTGEFIAGDPVVE